TSKEEPAEPADEGAYSADDDKKTPLPTEAGLHRVVWNLHHDGAQAIKGAKVDSGNPKVGPLALPGGYEIRLTVEGKTLTSHLTILLSPRRGKSPLSVEVESLWKQHEFLL